MIIVYADAAVDHSACWQTTGQSAFTICEGSYPFGDGVENISVGVNCPTDGLLAKCSAKENPILGTTVNGETIIWYYSNTGRTLEQVKATCATFGQTVIYP